LQSTKVPAAKALAPVSEKAATADAASKVFNKRRDILISPLYPGCPFAISYAITMPTF
jgi:hypothetical protein